MMNLGWENIWSGEGDESDMQTLLVSETNNIPGRDYPNPSELNRSRLQFRPGLQSLGYKQQEFGVWGFISPNLYKLRV
jgi:hypothetical protein